MYPPKPEPSELRKWFSIFVNIFLGLLFIAWTGQGLWAAIYVYYLVNYK